MILSRETTVVEDTKVDPRFFDYPLVSSPPGVRFYAGRPLLAPNEVLLGSLCVTDTRPRRLDAA